MKDVRSLLADNNKCGANLDSRLALVKCLLAGFSAKALVEALLNASIARLTTIDEVRSLVKRILV